ncbi:dihydrofolate reductase-like domain-containing protein [Spinellus fusiger]|nr:dihydrofolate reductase-like domain-containing protein [Spinellus fusiger]
MNCPVILMAASLSNTRGIGWRQDIVWDIPKDIEWLHRITKKQYNAAKHITHEENWQNVVVMGRLSWESIPMKGVPYESRFNIVISRNPEYNIHAAGVFPHAQLSHSLEDAISCSIEKHSVTGGRIFILGGAEVYEQSMNLPQSTHILLTLIHTEHTIECDSFMPVIDPNVYRKASHLELQEFVEEIVPEGVQTHGNLEYEFLLYIRI